MRTKLSFLVLVLCCLLTTTAFAQSRSVSQQDALTIAQRQFTGQDVDYFILQDNNQSVWTVFVDAEPMKGWEHKCYTLTIPKTITTSLSVAVPTSRTELKLPPAGNFAPLSVKNRYETNASSKPAVAKAQQSNSAMEASQRTYAIILSGGVNKMSNYERYWNDCSFIYQTLVNKYGVPKDNIYPIMSDGTDPAEDMRLTSGRFASQPLDLDNDGVADIKLSATKANVRNTLNSLATKLNKDDHLFFYVIDHGGTTDYVSGSYICLWDYENLYDYELAEMLTQFTDNFVNVNVVLGQCFSGGFNDNLRKTGCVVASASTGSESSWACSDIPYDEFVYQWTCAVNGANHRNVKVNADTDRNNRVTMLEAFEYAKAHDRRTNEHPQYDSTPISVGEDLAFNHLAPSVDLYIKDNPEDTGKEPNTTTNEFWKSPSIWVRNQDDGIYEHQNPEFSTDHQMAFVYVRVYNRGKEDYTGGKFIHVYWAQASTGLTTKAWKGREIYRDANTSMQFVTGGVMEATYIDYIPAGGNRDIRVRWSLPNLLENYPEGNFHFCLLGKIMDTPYDDGYRDGVAYFDLKGSNDQAQKNVTIIRKKDVAKGFNVYVRNIISSQASYTLELIPRTEADASIYSSAHVEMTMSPKVYAAWERGGFQYEDLELPSSNSNAADLRQVRLLSPESKVKNITLQGDEFDVVALKFDFNKFPIISQTYTFDLIQKDADGNVVGGETFIVESPTRVQRPIIIEPIPITPGIIELKASDSEFTNFTWTDKVGNKLGEGSSITVSPSTRNNKYTVTAMNEEGEVAEESIQLDVFNGIKSVSAEGGFINLSLETPAQENSCIVISQVVSGETSTFVLSPGVSEYVFRASGLSNGVYIVSYYTNDVIVDSRKITVN